MGEQLIVAILINIILASIMWFVHKRFDYSGSRQFLVVLTIFLPFIGLIWFVILTFMRMFRKKPIIKDNSFIDQKEFDEKNHFLDLFKTSQTMLMPVDSLNDDREKLLYLHFMMGAIDKLSRAISDEKQSELWFYLASGAESVILFGPKVDTQVLEAYGRSRDNNLQKAGETGWKAMHMSLLASLNELSSDDFTKSSLALGKLIRSKR